MYACPRVPDVTAFVPPTAAKQIDMRRGSDVRAGTYRFDIGEDVVTGWHTHHFHEVEYAIEGVAEVETESARFLLPPQQAMWIPAGVAHCPTLTRVKTVAVFFDPAMVPGTHDRARTLAAAPVIREMMIYGERWPISRSSGDATADAYFEVLATLVFEWLDHEIPLSLPTTTDPVVSAAMDYTNAHLDQVELFDVCRAIGVSDRSLRRAFSAVTGMAWRDYLLQSRLMRAMAILAEPGPTVLETATRVGFGSVSAFTRAFRRHTGETPTSYRRRVLAGREHPTVSR
ncbi:helix-turn-helix transcriptional regulator [Frankia sp. AgB1.9]|uniref:AraC family transcriptional regulator n=1 Tax=unclassified Frankia TaxID=2632575 RepID=UPI00193248EE|nr:MULTISPECIES: helix-turn-helix transcriptional regulator [unclassified Frankia]MBL7489996.1 helix-turn-helix transcriptional regulator [Frankia sp. AgW1.1]MBL7550585.1 helix-turn-helix transcriptional regulator [Frankia sp. AgB1.9]MBL7619822.1 helix-turn-helix transcriptional regulator [Frankia sp. AgB1.8]